MLGRTGMRYKVVVISACYSGVFIPRLANPDTLVITAADADHPSFGCRDKAKWTYFGNAFFNVALRQAKSLKDAFIVARSLVKKREVRERFEPSNPLMAGGENVQPLLIARPWVTGRLRGRRQMLSFFPQIFAVIGALEFRVAVSARKFRFKHFGGQQWD
jgi:Peptidase C13 family